MQGRLGGTRPRLDNASFNKIKNYITSNYGIKLEESKRTLVESRIGTRLMKLGLSSYSQYLDYAFRHGTAQEKKVLTDLITTNKTDFFREADHFEVLSNETLPSLLKLYGRGQEMKVWSSACSSGEEVYTLAMILEDFRKAGGLKYNLLGTDISTQVIKKARDGVYKFRDIVPVPDEYKRKYILRSKDPASQLVRIRPELREKVRFDYFNLMNRKYDKGKFHIIFCRNVLIYFDGPTQKEVIEKLYNSLHIGGYLFIGHSESIMGTTVNFKRIKPTIYQKVDG